MQKWEYKVTREGIYPNTGDLKDINRGLNIAATLPVNRTVLEWLFQVTNLASAKVDGRPPLDTVEQDLLDLDPTWELVSVTPEKMFFGGREKDHLGEDLNGKIEHLETTSYVCWWKRPKID